MTTWTLASRLPTSTKTDLLVLQWTRHRNAACNAAWPITHKAMLAMAEGDAPRCLGGLVQLTTRASAVSAMAAGPTPGACWVNGVLANVKRATSGRH